MHRLNENGLSEAVKPHVINRIHGLHLGIWVCSRCEHVAIRQCRVGMFRVTPGYRPGMVLPGRRSILTG
jgi:hypothetical protein